MLLKKIAIAIVTFCFCLTSTAFASYEFIFLSFPKSGSCMMRKLLTMMSDDLGYEKAGKYFREHFYCDRYPPFGINQAVVYFSNSLPTLVMVRDFRDILVSLSFWFDKRVEKGSSMNLEFRSVPQHVQQEWLQLTLSEKMTAFLLANFHPEVPHFGDVFLREYENMQYFLSRLKSPYIIKFENLVGPHGGGTREAQEEEVSKVAEMLSISLSADELAYLCDNLYGLRNQDQGADYSHTFRRGQIGTWKERFTEEHIQLFKEHYNEALLELGYETTENWGLYSEAK